MQVDSVSTQDLTGDQLFHLSLWLSVFLSGAVRSSSTIFVHSPINIPDFSGNVTFNTFVPRDRHTLCCSSRPPRAYCKSISLRSYRSNIGHCDRISPEGTCPMHMHPWTYRVPLCLVLHLYIFGLAILIEARVFCCPLTVYDGLQRP